MQSTQKPTPIIRETLLSLRPKSSSRVVALISIVFLFLTSVLYWEGPLPFSSKMAAIPERVFTLHEYWRVFTAMLAHSDWEHFFGNAISLFLLAYLLHGYFGLWVYPCASLLLGACANLLSLLTYPPSTVLLGASGLVYSMAGFWLSVYFCIDRRFSLGSRTLRVTGFAFVLLVPSTVLRGVSYRTHGFGFVLGMLYGLGYFLWNKAKIRAVERVEYENSENDDPPPILWN